VEVPEALQELPCLSEPLLVIDYGFDAAADLGHTFLQREANRDGGGVRVVGVAVSSCDAECEEYTRVINSAWKWSEVGRRALMNRLSSHRHQLLV